MTRILTALALSCTLSAVSVGALEQTAGKDPKLGTRITIRGCLHEGTDENSFVMLGMTERPAAADEMANVAASAPPMTVATMMSPRAPLPIYWLESTKGLKERVGQIIDITGEVQEKKTKTGTITVTINPDDSLSKEVSLESGTKQATTEKFRPAGKTPPASTVVMTRPSYFLSVQLVQTVTVPATPCK